MRPAAFLDRDGVVNRAIVVNGKPWSPMTVAEFDLDPAAVAGCAELAAAGVPIVVITNQPEIARGRLALTDLEVMHAQIRAELPVLDVLVCPHDDADGCRCRKPLPGLLEQAAVTFDLDLPRSVMVGDRWSDIGAARAAGCQAVLIGDGYSEPAGTLVPDLRAAALTDVVPRLLDLLKPET